jgi:serine/threonine protein kinase
VTSDPSAAREPTEDPRTARLSDSEIPADPAPRGPGAIDALSLSFPTPTPSAANIDRIEGFELIRVLGEGAFARVYLARQISLGRLVALKVTPHSGREARVLAGLEHDFIVRVFSETTDADKRLWLLCMQYVAGPTLRELIDRLYDGGTFPTRGRAIVDALDAMTSEAVAFDPAAMRDRSRLEQDDFLQAVCWMGARLAEALAYAHNRGVLHCDIKPANVLVTRYGRPMLADFNVAATIGPDADPKARLGGTFSYMAPEHLEAFLGGSVAAVDARSDIYSLGLVLFELLTGKRPFERVGSNSGERLELLTAQRRAGPPPPKTIRPETPDVLDRVIRRCLAPAPADRQQSAGELARALEGCADLRSHERALPRPGPLTRRALRHPFAIGFCLFLLPHIIGSIVNISYHSLQIVNTLTDAQQLAFIRVTLVYNVIIYSVCIYVIVRLITPIIRAWRELREGALPAADYLAWVRRRVLSLPAWAIPLSCVGWFPGAVLFPLYIHWQAGPLRPDAFLHFLISFSISGLIALTYAVFAAQYIAVRILYPHFWSDPQEFHATARKELHSQRLQLWVFQLLAGLIPLGGAVLMVGVGPNAVESYGTFRVLVTGLIALGMAGFGLAIGVSQYLNNVVASLTGTAGQAGRDGIS